MTIWVVSREYAGIAEAGGVKNVACSLSEALVKMGHRVVLFIPLYGCTDLNGLESFNCIHKTPVSVTLCGKNIPVTFSSGKMNGVEIIFVGNKCFSEKKAVYTYTKDEELADSSHKKGTGHQDSMYMDTLFQKAVVAYGDACSMEEAPAVILCHDASAAMIPAFILDRGTVKENTRQFFKSSKCFVTIHNAGPGYHHEFYDYNQAQYFTHLDPLIIEKARNGNVIEPFLLGAQNAVLTTVSPEYAQEILENKTETGGLSQCFREKGIGIEGITNGIDFERYDPSCKENSGLPFTYNPQKKDFEGKLKCRKYFLEKYASPEGDSEILESAGVETYGYLENNAAGTDGNEVYFSFHGRIVEQKGIRILSAAADMLLARDPRVRFIFMGQGQGELERLFLNIALKYEGRCVFFRGYEKALTRLCLASGDFSVIPSVFEPCCLEDFISQILGTVPIAHNTGGLGKIQDGKTGYLYSPNTPEILAQKLEEAAEFAALHREKLEEMACYSSLYVKNNYSWDTVAQEKYMKLFGM